ncbi:hypothetical protein [Parafrigoribacterium humi]|uniref:hypothetical protein n=1 Tax=Parafrigoribacterium humi TaxID=3144664 RepID=UPI0032EF573F
MTAQPLPRQSWETDADYQARLASWEGSATKEETPRANEGSVSETLKEETNMSIVSETTNKRELTDADLVDGQLYELGDESKWFKPIARKMRIPVSAIPPETVVEIRNKPSDIPAISYPFSEATDSDGNKIKFAPLPKGASFKSNYLFKENGITYVGRGIYWTDGLEEVDGIEYVNFTYGQGDLPCPVHDWCNGHYLRDIEAFERSGDKLELDFCVGPTMTFFEFNVGEPGDSTRPQRLAGSRSVNDDGEEQAHIFAELEVTCNRTSAQKLAAELHAAADALAMYAAGMERA